MKKNNPCHWIGYPTTWITVRVFSVLILQGVFLTVLPQAFAQNSSQLTRTEVHRIKAQESLSGPDQARATHKYIRHMSNDQLIALLEQVGADQFLQQLPLKQGGQASDRKAEAWEHTTRPDHRASSTQRPIQRYDVYQNGRRRIGSTETRFRGTPSKERERPEPHALNQTPHNRGEERHQLMNSEPGNKSQNREVLKMAVQVPEHREHLIRMVSNYLLNTTSK